MCSLFLFLPLGPLEAGWKHTRDCCAGRRLCKDYGYGFWRCIKAHWAFMCRVSSFRDLVRFRTWSSVASLTWPAFLVSLSRCMETGARDLARRRCGISPGISSCVGCLVTETSCAFALGAASRPRRGQQSQFLDPNASINWASLDCGRTKQG